MVLAMAKKVHKREASEERGGFLKGLADVLDKLNELAETGRELAKSGEFTAGPGREVKGVYGFNVRMGLGGTPSKVEPFGNIKVDKRARQPVVVQEVREPPVDVMEEGDHILLVAEMPGIAAPDVHVDIKGDILTLSAERGDKKYRKEVLLPKPCQSQDLSVNCNNGIVEIRCQVLSQQK